MNIANIIKFDTGNARGLSVVVFVSGCTNYCQDCHNKETWDFDYGEELTVDKLEEISNALDNPHIKNLVISGGDPMNLKNLEGTLLILNYTKAIREKFKQKTIVYTGYTLEELKERPNKEIIKLIFSQIDYLIDGKYDKEKKTKILDYRGSTNQKCWKRKENSLEFTDYSNYYFKEN